MVPRYGTGPGSVGCLDGEQVGWRDRPAAGGSHPNRLRLAGGLLFLRLSWGPVGCGVALLVPRRPGGKAGRQRGGVGGDRRRLSQKARTDALAAGPTKPESVDDHRHVSLLLLGEPFLSILAAHLPAKRTRLYRKRN